ncbi:MAG: hypothetical protein K0R73_841 [Candidatus Midichloriaceae bacterium]|jgi:chromosome segregation ATPase|nr:hypothetical protein [Candidatus Midichloriaceae bacterium]
MREAKQQMVLANITNKQIAEIPQTPRPNKTRPNNFGFGKAAGEPSPGQETAQTRGETPTDTPAQPPKQETPGRIVRSNSFAGTPSKRKYNPSLIGENPLISSDSSSEESKAEKPKTITRRQSTSSFNAKDKVKAKASATQIAVDTIIQFIYSNFSKSEDAKSRIAKALGKIANDTNYANRNYLSKFKDVSKELPKALVNPDKKIEEKDVLSSIEQVELSKVSRISSVLRKLNNTFKNSEKEKGKFIFELEGADVVIMQALTKKLEKLEKATSKLENITTAELNKRTQLVESLRTSIKELNGETSKLQEELEEAKKELEELPRLRQGNYTLQQTNASLEGDVEKLNEALKKKDEKIKEANQELMQKAGEIEVLENIKLPYKKALEKIQQLAAQLTELEENNKLLNSFKATLTTTLESTQSQSRELNTKIKDLTTNLMTAEKALEEAKLKEEDLTKKNETEINFLKMEKTNLTTELAKLENLDKETKIELKEVKAQLAESQEETKKLVEANKNLVSEHGKEVLGLRAELQTLKEEKATVELEKAGVTLANTTLEGKNSELQTQLGEQQAASKTKDAEIVKLKAEKEQLAKQVSTTSIEETQNKLSEAETKLTAKDTEIADLNKAVATEKAAKEAEAIKFAKEIAAYNANSCLAAPFIGAGLSRFIGNALESYIGRFAFYTPILLAPSYGNNTTHSLVLLGLSSAAYDVYNNQNANYGIGLAAAALIASYICATAARSKDESHTLGG